MVIIQTEFSVKSKALEKSMNCPDEYFSYFFVKAYGGDAQLKCCVKAFRMSTSIQSNLNSSNTDGLFTMANSNSFMSPYEILPIAQENKYLRKFSYFIWKLYVVCIHYNCLIEAILMSTLNIPLLCGISKRFP